MGSTICKECSKWSSTVTNFCQHCGTRLFPLWVDLAVYSVVLVLGTICNGLAGAGLVWLVWYALDG